jgi:hypothetical protein
MFQDGNGNAKLPMAETVALSTLGNAIQIGLFP